MMSALNVEAAMPLTGPIPEGRSFFCPHCGALYAVTYSRQTNSESNVAKCVVCGQTMATWNSTDVPTYKLVHRPEDA
jgi:transcription elongation factor Elf1